MTPLIRPYQRAPEMFGIPLKYIGLLTLCIQNSTLVTIMRYSRLGHKDALYFTSAAVFLSELSKFLICLYYAIKDQKIRKGYRSPRELFNEVFAHDARKLVVLAVLYTIQNNLQYIALKWFSLLLLTLGIALVKKLKKEDEDDVMVFEKILGLTSVAIGCIAGVYFEKVLKGTPTSIWIRNVQLSFLSLFLLWLWEFVTYQLKILTTALCSVIMLKISLTKLKWFSLLLLTLGIALVKKLKKEDEDDVMVFEKILGLTSVAIGCIAGVYFEKVLKGTPTSIWIRNVQLSFLSLFLLWLWEFGEKMRCQAIGGIIVVMEVKYGEYT
ncbi:9218_t:CDS:2 [Entrophospora sp. SA101]|nr:9218_t:CDS:2 [Entrophospora sp. SA101]